MSQTITTTLNGIELKTKNKRINVFKTDDGINRIEVISLTSETGNGKSAISKLSKNKKIKYSGISFSDEAIELLYYVLHEYLINKITNK